MVATKRKQLVPKNIDTMSDAEYEAWFQSLDSDTHCKLQGRTFKGKPEWFVYAEAKDSQSGRDLQGTWDTLDEAMRQYNDLIADASTIGAEVEKVVGHYDVLERENLGDRDYTSVAKFGEFTDEE